MHMLFFGGVINESAERGSLVSGSGRVERLVQPLGSDIEDGRQGALVFRIALSTITNLSRASRATANIGVLSYLVESVGQPRACARRLLLHGDLDGLTGPNGLRACLFDRIHSLLELDPGVRLLTFFFG